LARNAEQDLKAEHAVVDMGGRVLTIWKCETKDVDAGTP
jgi:G:T-mismatch repair DNA endonuclease (very short patch repair protein)